MENSESGEDNQGTEYKNINEMWKKELECKQQETNPNLIGSKETWYKTQEKYWDKQKEDGTYNGVLGGYGFLHPIDIDTSKKLLENFLSSKIIGRKRALDCGAGIGRITKDLLSEYFDQVDILEQSEYYINEAKQFLQGVNIGKFYKNGMQDFEFEQNYNCIWIQWVAIYLTDEDFIDFLKRASRYLEDDENVLMKGFSVDKEDCSVTRSDAMYKEIFEAADFKLIYESVQQNFPKELFSVKIYGFQKK